MMVPCYLVFAGFFIIYMVAWLRWKGIAMDVDDDMQRDPRVPPIVGTCKFVDGRTRYVYEDDQAGQFVFGDDGEPVYGVWIKPEPDDADTPAIVDLGRHHQVHEQRDRD